MFTLLLYFTKKPHLLPFLILKKDLKEKQSPSSSTEPQGQFFKKGQLEGLTLTFPWHRLTRGLGCAAAE